MPITYHLPQLQPSFLPLSMSYSLTTDVPRYVVDLDAPAATRWNHVVADFSETLPTIFEHVDDILEDILGGRVLSTLVTKFLAGLAHVGLVAYGDELKGLAASTGVPLGKLVMLQIAYEAFASCTSIVAPASASSGSVPLMIRTMDWEMQELCDLAIEVDFQRGGRTVCLATSWAGYVGILTGMKMDPASGGSLGSWSASINYRRTSDGSFAKNIWEGARSSWPIGFLLRACFEDDTTASYTDAVATLSSSALMAPTYITLAGSAAGEGIVLVRERDGAIAEGRPVDGVSGATSWLPRRAELARDSFVVQCNMDPGTVGGDDVGDDWQDICDSRHRFAVGSAALESLVGGSGSGGAAASPAPGTTMDDLWSIATLPPIHAHDTVYTVAMCPATGEYASRVAIPSSAKRKAKKRWRKLMLSRERLRAQRSSGGATRQ